MSENQLKLQQNRKIEKELIERLAPQTDCSVDEFIDKNMLENITIKLRMSSERLLEEINKPYKPSLKTMLTIAAATEKHEKRMLRIRNNVE